MSMNLRTELSGACPPAAMTTAERTGRMPELDGVRGLAILLVLVGHAAAPYQFGSLATAGVTLFFALSGYLITGLLHGEYQRQGRLSLGRFYARRFTRLAPPLLLMLTVTGLVMRPGWDRVLLAMSWTVNYVSLTGHEVTPYGHTWSLATEEQFYLLWPLAFLRLMRQGRRAVWVLGWVVLVLVAWRTLLTLTGHLVYAYVAFETAGSAILAGCLVALARWRLAGRWAILSLAGLLTVALAASVIAGWLLWLVVPLLVTPLAAALVASAGSARWLAWRPLAFCGVASYSMYLWHEPVSRAVNGGLAPVGVTAGALVGLLSYWLLEAPLMRWRGRESQRPADALQVTPVAAPSTR